MSTPIQPSGIDVPSWRTSPPALGSPIFPPGPSAVTSDGQADRRAAVEQRLAGRRPCRPRTARRRRWPWAPEEREAHAAADEHLVGHAEEGVDHLELVAHLRAAEDGDERAGGVLPQAERAPPPRAPAAGRPALGRCAAGRRSRRGHGATRRRRRSRRRRSPSTSCATKAGSLASSPGSKRRFSSSSTPGASSARPGPDRRHRVAVSGAPFGRPKWVARDHGRALALQPLDGGQGGADAQVVGDAPVLDGHVEVGAQQDPLAREGRQVLQRGDAEGGHG